MKPSEIITYIKDQKEKGYEAETILKGLEVKLELEQDTSEKYIKCKKCGYMICPERPHTCKNNKYVVPEPLKEDWRKELMDKFCVMFERAKDETVVERLEDFISQVEQSAYRRGQNNPDVSVASVYGFEAGYEAGKEEVKREIRELAKDYSTGKFYAEVVDLLNKLK